MNEKLLTLPWEIQVALGSGYAAYILAYVGIRDHHKGVDTAFRAIAFGLIATITFALVPRSWPIVRVGGAIFATLAGGLVWRWFGIEFVRKSLRHTNLSWADDTPSAWATISANNSKSPVTQISVLMDDGTWLNCDQNGDFNDSPFGPCVLGPNGDVALYVTSEVSPEGVESKNPHVCDPLWGDRVTYVPAGKIKRIAIRHLRKS